jgi:CDGSH-type Zn-finger protein
MSAHSGTAPVAPAVATAATGRTYLWCKCGRSFARPFCDGTHEGGCCRRDDAAEATPAGR